MVTKIMLTIEKEAIEIAKKYAEERGQSLSELVENYFKYLANKSTNFKQNKSLT